MIGKTIGNYEITDRLGAGGMGEVYRARDTKLDRDVAIKVLPEGVASDAERLARFEREAKLLAGLNHPNIGAIYGVEEADGATYLVLELVDGEDLAKRLAGGALTQEETLGIARQIAEALEAAHEQGVVHRDLKPANVVITPDGTAKVLDFGLAKALDTGSTASSANLSNSPTVMASSPTLAGVILGTAAYMSPEQARGRPVDKRADIFAFGAVVWEMLTGRQLFVGETVSDTLAAVLRHEPDFDTLPAGIHPALRRLLARCLEKDVRLRLRDIGEARIALVDIAGGKAEAVTAVAGERPGFWRQNAGWIATGVVVVASLIMMSTMRGDGTATGGDTTAGAPLRKFAIPLDANDPSVVAGFKAEISPDGRFLLYPQHGQLWVRDLTSTEAHPIVGSENGTKPFWSPDGSEIAFGDGPVMYRVPREGGQRQTIGNLPSGIRLAGAASGAWSADGLITFGSSTDGLFQVSARGGEIREVLLPGEGETDFHQIAALPDGKGWMIVIHTDHGIGDVDLVTPALERHPLLRLDDQVQDVAWSPTGHLVFERSGSTPGLWAVRVSLEPVAVEGEPFLIAAGGADPSISGDGTLVYTRGIGDSKGQLTLIDRSGNVLGTVGDPFESARPFPKFSADGRSIFIAENVDESREIFQYDMASGNRRRLTFDDRRDDLVSYVDEGRIISYESNTYAAQILTLDGSAEPVTFQDAIMATIAPDGATLLYARQRGVEWNWDIVMRPLDGPDEPSTLVQTDGVDWWPQVSPDGKYLLYMSSETGQDEVYLTTFPRPSTRWEVSNGAGSWPRWRFDGGEIYFVVNDRIMAVPVDYRPGITLGRPEVVFEKNRVFWSSRWPDGYDISPDGKTFVTVQPVRDESATPPAIVVVQNWWAEFER